LEGFIILAELALSKILGLFVVCMSSLTPYKEPSASLQYASYPIKPLREGVLVLLGDY